MKSPAVVLMGALLLAGCGSVRYPTTYVLNFPPQVPQAATTTGALGPISAPEGWLFANPVTRKSYHQEEIQKRYIRNVGIEAEIGATLWNPRNLLRGLVAGEGFEPSTFGL
jgi:hypothetical protein